MPTRHIKFLVKIILSNALYYTGMLHLYKYLFFRNSVLVLMYHRVLDNDEIAQSYSHPGIIVTKNLFENQMCFLKQTFNVINPDQLSEWLYNKKQPPPFSCLITFDDGWHDNYKNAYPVFKKYKIPAVIFLACNFIDSNDLFWQEKLASFLHKMAENSAEYGVFLRRIGLIIDDQMKQDLKTYIRDIITSLKNKTQSDIDSIINAVLKHSKNTNLAPPDFGVDKYMNWENVSEMSDSGVSFGSHTCSHSMLTKLDPTSAIFELKKSKEILESRLSKMINYIAYPNGNYNDAVKTLTQAAGYRIAFSTEDGKVNSDSDKYSLHRINIHTGSAGSLPMFFSTILRIF